MIKFSCRHYRVSKPCLFNKRYGSECGSCQYCSEYDERILFIKLDAVGDVLRSASLLPAIVARHKAPYIAWLTREESVPVVGMMKYVDEVIELSEIGIARVVAGAWDCVYSLSNDLPSAAIATIAKPARGTIGYYLDGGVIKPTNAAAEHWLEMAAFDRLKRENTRSYQELMLAIIGEDAGEIAPPLLDVPGALMSDAANRIASLFPGSSRPKIAVNVGAGGRWPKKMLDVRQTCQFIARLYERADLDVILVGGVAEIDKAMSIASQFEHESGPKMALTTESIPEFVALLSQVQAMLCGDTLALHIATAIGLPTVAVFGPTSVAEIPEFKGLIKKVWSTELTCLGCYGDCTKDRHCMSQIDVDLLVDGLLQHLSRRNVVYDRKATSSADHHHSLLRPRGASLTVASTNRALT